MRKVYAAVASCLALTFFSGCGIGFTPELRTGEYFLSTARQWRWHDDIGNRAYRSVYALIAPYDWFWGYPVGLVIAPTIDVFCIPYDTSMRMHDTVIRVIDDRGAPVANASINIELRSDYDWVRGRTDANGEFHPHGDLRVLEIDEYKVSCNGYYAASARYNYETEYLPEIDSSNRIILKVTKIDKPVAMAFGELDSPRRWEKDQYRDYDCEYGDWLPPHGVGKHADLRVGRRTVSGTTAGAYTVVLSWHALEPDCGFERRNAFHPIDMITDKRVPDGLNFTTNTLWCTLSYDKENRYGRLIKSDFDEDHYYVMRLRSVTNSVGEVVGARYGKIVISPGRSNCFDTYLNEKMNEKSLEARLGENPAYKRRRDAGDKWCSCVDRVRRP